MTKGHRSLSMRPGWDATNGCIHPAAPRPGCRVQRIWLRNSCVRGSRAFEKNSVGVPCSTMTPRSVKINVIGELAGETHLMGHQHAGHAFGGELADGDENLLHRL